VKAQLKVLFDECVGKPIMEAIARIVSTSPERPEFRHMVDYQSQGALDEEWVPKVATEGWIVITGDRGRSCGGAKLPHLCKAYRITHVMLSARLHTMRSSAKATAILAVWEDLAKLVSEPKGCGYLLRLTSKGHPKLERLYEPPTDRPSEVDP
jgi:PIN like domain